MFRAMRATLLSLLVLAGCAHAPASASVWVVSAADRTDADRALDQGRKPAELLAFLELKPGMHVAELVAGGGYTTELLARAIGPGGKVYGQNPKWLLERFAEAPWTERLQRPVNSNVVRVDRETDDPFPTDVGDLDVVVSYAIYHDTVWQNSDRGRMNAAVFTALKSGGRYVICDSSAREGSGLEDVQTLHRIDSQIVKTDVENVGFKLAAEGNFLRNPDDTRDWSASPAEAAGRRGTSDRFCFSFQKP